MHNFNKCQYDGQNVYHLTRAVNNEYPGVDPDIHRSLGALYEVSHVGHNILHGIFVSGGLGKVGVNNWPSRLVVAYLTLPSGDNGEKKAEVEWTMIVFQVSVFRQYLFPVVGHFVCTVLCEARPGKT